MHRGMLSMVFAASTFCAACAVPPERASGPTADAWSLPAIAAHAPPAPNACADDAGWDDPAVPRHVFGNTWYVGTCGISALLVVSPAGAVLIDGTTERSAQAVERNIAKLGVPLHAVRIILGSHEHPDHAGGIAQLQRDTGATVLVRAPAAATLRSGHADRGDPQSRVLGSLPSVAQVKIIEDGQVVRVGDALALTAHATPGHAPGGMSWTWTECEGERCVRMAYVDSLTAISDAAWRFDDDGAHPGYLAAFRATLATVAALPCDLLVTPHPDASALWQRLPPHATQPLVDPGACKAYAERGRAALDARLAKERAEAAP